jgi:hypothetical protein
VVVKVAAGRSAQGALCPWGWNRGARLASAAATFTFPPRRDCVRRPSLKGKNVILIDDLLTTGGSALACYDKLTAEGANVLGVITCGKTVYDKTDPPFGAKQFDLTEELSDQRDKSPFSVAPTPGSDDKAS